MIYLLAQNEKEDGPILTHPQFFADSNTFFLLFLAIRRIIRNFAAENAPHRQ